MINAGVLWHAGVWWRPVGKPTIKLTYIFDLFSMRVAVSCLKPVGENPAKQAVGRNNLGRWCSSPQQTQCRNSVWTATHRQRQRARTNESLLHQ